MTSLARTASTPTLTQSVTLRRFLATVLSAILDEPQALPDFHQNRETRVLAHELVYLFAAPSPHVLSPIVFEWSVGGPFSDAVAALLREMAEDQTCAPVNAEDRALAPEAQRSIAIVRELLGGRPPALTVGRWAQLLASLHFIAHSLAAPSGRQELRFDDPDVAAAASSVQPPFTAAEVRAGVACLQASPLAESAA